MENYSDEFEYLVSAGIALDVKAISRPSYPLIENSGKNLLKLYLNDVGLLTALFSKTTYRLSCRMYGALIWGQFTKRW